MTSTPTSRPVPAPQRAPAAPPAAGAGAAPAAGSGSGLLVGVLVVATFVMILNETIVSVALPVLAGELAVPASTVQWLTSGFLLTMAVVIPTTGYLLQRFTARQMFTAALVLFSTGTLVAALAPGFPVLLGGRVLQAAGTAVMIPLLLTTILRVVPAERRGSTMGTVSIVIAVAPALGPTVGGAILATLGWRAMFWVVLPLAVVVLLVGGPRLRVPATERPARLDVLSVLLSAVGFGALVYGSSALGEGGEGAAVPAWVPLVVGGLALVAFVRRQLRLARDGRALLDLGPLRYRPFAVASVLMVLLFAALLGIAAVLLPLHLQTVLGYDALVTGLAVLPGGLVLGLLGRPVGRLYDRHGARALVVPGAVAMAVALWVFAVLPADVPLAAVIGAHVLLMAAFAFVMTPVMTDGLGVLPGALQSHGSAIMTTLQQVAGAFGTAGLITIATVASASEDLDAGGLRVAFVAGGVIGTAALGVALLVRRGPAAGAAAGAAAPSPH
jgi:DHA2 family lincomycin resistance protein-like MFS transporter